MTGSSGARRRPGVVLLALPLALAACTQDEEPPPVPELEQIRSQIEAARPDPRERWDRIEELTAACMAEQGFEYTPVPYGRGDEWTLADAGTLVPGTRAFAEQFGYGEFTLTRITPAEDAPADENLERLLEMSPGELPAYTDALWGTIEPSAVEVDLGLERLGYTEVLEDPDAELGCYGKAQREVDAGDAGLDPDVYAQLSWEMDQLDKEIAADPRLDGANRRWASCMLDAGYPDLTRVEDARYAVVKEMDRRLVEAEATWPSGLSVAEMDHRAFLVQLDIVDFEVAMAVADLDCREESGYDDEVARVSAERQAAFLEEHRTELEAWLDAALAAAPTPRP